MRRPGAAPGPRPALAARRGPQSGLRRGLLGLRSRPPVRLGPPPGAGRQGLQPGWRERPPPPAQVPGVGGGCAGLPGRQPDRHRRLCQPPLLALCEGLPRVSRGDGGAGAGPAVVAVVPLEGAIGVRHPVILVGMCGGRCAPPITSRCIRVVPWAVLCSAPQGGGGLGWVGLGQGLAWSPTHGPRRLPCGTRLGGRTRVSGNKAYRTVDRPQTPRWRSRAGDAAVPVCMCPCVSEGGGGGLWHTCLVHCCSALAHMARGSVCLVLQAPAGRLESLTLSPPGEMWAWARNLHVTRTCYPTTPRLPIGTGRRWYVARLGSDPHSLTASGTGGAASRAGSGSHGRGRTLGRWRDTRAQSVLPCPGCHQCWLHWLRRYSPRRRGGPEGTTPEWPLR